MLYQKPSQKRTIIGSYCIINSMLRKIGDNDDVQLNKDGILINHSKICTLSLSLIFLNTIWNLSQNLSTENNIFGFQFPSYESKDKIVHNDKLSILQTTYWYHYIIKRCVTSDLCTLSLSPKQWSNPLTYNVFSWGHGFLHIETSLLICCGNGLI